MLRRSGISNTYACSKRMQNATVSVKCSNQVMLQTSFAQTAITMQRSRQESIKIQHCCLTVLQDRKALLWVAWGRMTLAHVQLFKEREKKKPVIILFSDYFSSKADTKKITLHINFMLFGN